MTNSNCPRCGHENLCQNSDYNIIENVMVFSEEECTNKNKETKCWCMSMKLNEHQQQEIKKYAKSKRCLCAACIAALSE